ncbi:MAG: WYL domain-containing protein [Bacilli bacterium]|nr:WYL domain-containing protein [Bacilli bacterium]
MLNERCDGKTFISVTKIAEELECSTRQARRYLEDLAMILEIPIITTHGRDGGYRLGRPLDKGIAMDQGLVLALSIAMRRNEHVEAVLSKLPNYVVTERVGGDYSIDNATMGNLDSVFKAMEKGRKVRFLYKDQKNPYEAEPYKIYYTNHAYYLFYNDAGTMKKVNISLMRDVQDGDLFKKDEALEKKLEDRLSKYGIMDGKPATLRVKCKDEEALFDFERYFEGKGTADRRNLTFSVDAADQHELYYPLFRIKTGSYEFLDEWFKRDYVNYLKRQIKAISSKTQKE